MTDTLRKRWSPHLRVVENQLGDETVILHLDSGKYFGLDNIGTKIWTMLKGGELPDEICIRLAAEYDVDRFKIEEDLAELLDNMIRQGLVTEA